MHLMYGYFGAALIAWITAIDSEILNRGALVSSTLFEGKSFAVCIENPFQPCWMAKTPHASALLLARIPCPVPWELMVLHPYYAVLQRNSHTEYETIPSKVHLIQRRRTHGKLETFFPTLIGAFESRLRERLGVWLLVELHQTKCLRFDDLIM